VNTAPWTTHKQNGRKVIDKEGRVVAMAAKHTERGADAWTNAKIIAAAPDLLAACKSALGAIRLEQQINPSFSPAWKHIAEPLADAIAKAEGGAK
jgi:hypothetical protein